MKTNPLLERLKYHVTGAIERGEGEAIVGIPSGESAVAFSCDLNSRRVSIVYGDAMVREMVSIGRADMARAYAAHYGLKFV